MKAKVTHSLLDRARSSLSMEESRDREVLAEALQRYAAANPPLAEPVQVDIQGHLSNVLVMRDARDEMLQIRQALGAEDTAMGVGIDEATERALAYVSRDAATTATADGRMPTPGVPPLIAPDPAGVFTRDARNPVVDPVYLLFLGGNR